MDYIKELFTYWPQIASVLAMLGSIFVYLDNRRRQPLEDQKLAGEIELDDAEEVNLIGKTYAELLNQLRVENTRLRGLEEKVEVLVVELEREKIQGKAETEHRRKLQLQMSAVLKESVEQSARIQQVETENAGLKKLVTKLEAELESANAQIERSKIKIRNYQTQIETLKNGKSGIL